MENIAIFILWGGLAMLTYQDFRYRAISWWLLPVIALAILYIRSLEVSWQTMAGDAWHNFLFLSVMALVLTALFSWKKRSFVILTRGHIGWGDVLFLLVLCGSFPLSSYVLFFEVSVLLTWLCYLLYANWFKPSERLVPLAGGMALTYIGISMLGRLLEKDVINHSADMILALVTLS